MGRFVERLDPSQSQRFLERLDDSLDENNAFTQFRSVADQGATMAS
jgi:hypothetical protein